MSGTQEDARLVGLVEEVLVDPNLHTDTRMRLHREIPDLLHEAHAEIYGTAGDGVHQRRMAEHGDQLPRLLESVLIDPNLHTDLRMRLHHEIPELLEAAESPARIRSSGG